MAYVPLVNLVPQFFDNLGDPLVGGTLSAYVAGTSTPTNMFSNNTGTVAGTSVTLDSRGEPTTIKLIWLNTAVNYKFILKDSNNTTIWTIDNIVPDALVDGSVTTSKLANGSVTTAKLADDAVTTVKIVDNNITTAKIADNAITNIKMADDAVNTAEIMDSAVTTAKIANSSITAEKLAFNIYSVNRIINGSMAIDQRNDGSSQTFTAGAALAYCVDRWYGYCTGANITGQRITVSNENRYRFTGATSNTGLGFGQRIESFNCKDLKGSTCTLSVLLSSTSITSVTWTAYYANTDDTFGTLASPSRTQIATGNFTITSTESLYSTQINVPVAATTGIEIVFTTGNLTATNTLTIGNVQFEKGTSATTFAFRFINEELWLCQRYYEDSYGISSGFSNVNSYFGSTFAATKRVAPTMTWVITTGTGGVYSATANGFHQTTVNSSGSTASWTASAEL